MKFIHLLINSNQIKKEVKIYYLRLIVLLVTYHTRLSPYTYIYSYYSHNLAGVTGSKLDLLQAFNNFNNFGSDSDSDKDSDISGSTNLNIKPIQFIDLLNIL